MSTFITNIYNYILTIQPLSWMLLVVMAIIIGVMCIIPIKEVNEFAKKHIVLMVIGAFIIFAAVDLGQGMASSAGFYSGT